MSHWWPRLDNVEARSRRQVRWVQPYEKNREGEEGPPSRHYKVVGDGEAQK